MVVPVHCRHDSFFPIKRIQITATRPAKPFTINNSSEVRQFHRRLIGRKNVHAELCLTVQA
jgi:hypothetical protein